MAVDRALMWVRFTADFPWNPVPAQTIMFKAGMVRFVPRRCAEAAIARGVAQKATRPRKSEEADAGG